MTICTTIFSFFPHYTAVLWVSVFLTYTCCQSMMQCTVVVGLELWTYGTCLSRVSRVRGLPLQHHPPSSGQNRGLAPLHKPPTQSRVMHCNAHMHVYKKALVWIARGTSHKEYPCLANNRHEGFISTALCHAHIIYIHTYNPGTMLVLGEYTNGFLKKKIGHLA